MPAGATTLVPMTKFPTNNAVGTYRYDNAFPPGVAHDSYRQDGARQATLPAG